MPIKPIYLPPLPEQESTARLGQIAREMRELVLMAATLIGCVTLFLAVLPS